jgi:starch-binding outer membrane protein, SusD/RagB family
MKLNMNIKIVSFSKILKSIGNKQLATGKNQLAKPVDSRAFRIITPLHIVYCLLLIVLLGSCKKWIDVKPSDRLAEDQLFSTTKGYLNALNGVYVEMTNAAVYGENMTVSSLDAMGLYYYIADSRHQCYDLANNYYTTNKSSPIFDNMWKKAYELIINCNVIIERCGEGSNELLPGPYFGMVKGEALALRAMLHLDMLRVFGPIYTQADKNKPCIPYHTSSRPQVFPLLGSEEIMNNVINDLTAAIALLKEADPIITSGVRNAANPNGSNDMYYRQYRLNYYAAKALLARAYLWKQDKEKALQEALLLLTEAMDPAKPVFKLGVLNTATAPADFDHMVVQEVMFSLYTLNRQNIYTKFFSPDVAPLVRLSFNNNDNNTARQLALYDDGNDVRQKAWMLLSNPTRTFLTHVKYNVSTNTSSPNMMPLIRLSEVYLIAAECSKTLNEGTDFLNIVRKARVCVNLAPATTAQLKDLITREFRKEVFGEGQMYFYYKRNAMTSVPNQISLTGGNKSINISSYVMPLPVSEISVRSK